MTTDIQARLKGVNKEALEASAALSNLFPSDRAKYPLADFEGQFTGKLGTFREVNTRSGEIYEFPALIYKVTSILRKTDNNLPVNEGEYLVVVDDPQPDRVAQSRFGMMLQSAIDSGVVQSNLWETEGKTTRLTLAAKKPWATASRPNIYYRVSAANGNGAHAAPTPTINPEAETFALQFASGLSDAEFFGGVLPALQNKGLVDEALELEIATRRFLPRMVEEGRLEKDGETYALPA